MSVSHTWKEAFGVSTFVYNEKLYGARRGGIATTGSTEEEAVKELVEITGIPDEEEWLYLEELREGAE